MRPANIVTAVADVLAGMVLSGYFVLHTATHDPLTPVVFLILSTIGLYGGGVVLNDVFDAELDKTERPERPIPSGLVSKKSAALLGTLLLLAGILFASLAHDNWFSVSGFLATLIALAAVVYDKWGKHQTFLGPVNMGLCRGLNLLLGMSIQPWVVGIYWFLGLVPVVYIAAITMISRGEVHGGKKTTLYAAAALYALVVCSILIFSVFKQTLWYTLPFLVLFGLMIFYPLLKAIRQPAGPRIGKAVKAGVLSLIIMNASWAASVGSLGFAISILLLLPLSIWLARLFAVT